MGYKSNRNIVYSCKYHVVWCPKYRRSVLNAEVEERLNAIPHEVAKERGSGIIELEVMPDHVYLLVEVDPQFGIHRLVRLTKGRSSHHLRQEIPWLKNACRHFGQSHISSPRWVVLLLPSSSYTSKTRKTSKSETPSFALEPVLRSLFGVTYNILDALHLDSFHKSDLSI